jgi:aspartate kinase
MESIIFPCPSNFSDCCKTEPIAILRNNTDRTIVMKFGGTSVQDSQAIRRVANIVADHTCRRVVVVSAMAKVTDLLLNLAKIAAKRNFDEAMNSLLCLRTRHHLASRELLNKDTELLYKLEEQLEQYFEDLGRLIQVITREQHLSPRNKDEISAYGELLSSAIIEARLRAQGLNAELIDSRRLILTNNEFTNAIPDMVISRQRIRDLLLPALNRNSIPVVQGFIGSTLDSATTTLGRGGSDYTASIIGAALDADAIDIWTDVDGFMTADPRIVPDARRIAELSFDEATELTYFGAKILHPQTVKPAIEKGIPVHIFNTYNPANEGTKIGNYTHLEMRLVTSITYKRGVSVLTVHSNKHLQAWRFLTSVFDILKHHRVTAQTLTISGEDVSIVLESSEQITDLRDNLLSLGNIHTFSEETMICIVGNNLKSTPSIAARALYVLQEFYLERFNYGASERSLTFIVKEADTVEVLNQLHKEFFGKVSSP